MELKEAIETAEALAEWYVEGKLPDTEPGYSAWVKDLEMLEFFIKLGKNVQKAGASHLAN